MLGVAPALLAALVAASHACPPRPPVTEHRITHARWISDAVVTEYYPIRESWFLGRAASAPGLRGRHRVDWLYGPHGVAMNGEGLGVDGRYYHFAGPYGIGWVNSGGGATTPCWNGTWTRGKPAWLALGWRNRRGAVTYPLGHVLRRQRPGQPQRPRDQRDRNEDQRLGGAARHDQLASLAHAA